MAEMTRSAEQWMGRSLRLDWERAAWIAIVILTLLTRLWALGDRAMSHDESLHTFYSWKLYNGEGYQHDPMMHGPLLYHATALSYLLFGASDFTARLLAVVTGLALVLTPLLLRRWLGPVGALSTGVMLLISPSIMMYSRYIRHDIPVELFTVLMFVSFIRYLDDRDGKWVVLALAAAAGAITSAEMSYINGFVLVVFVLLAIVADLLGPRRTEWLSLGLGGLGSVVLLVSLSFNNGWFGLQQLAKGTTPYDIKQAGLLFGGLILSWAFASWWLSAEHEERGVWNAIKAMPLGALAAGIAVFAVIYALLFTTFFTNTPGIHGFYNSIVYWIEQHDVVRGDQPWYYYALLIAPLYEYLPLVLSLVALAFYSLRPGLRLARGAEGAAAGETPVAAWAFLPGLAAWGIGVFWTYSWAGEKMPWLVLHLAVPMTFLGGRLVADLAGQADRDWLRASGWQVVGVAALAFAAFLAILARGAPWFLLLGAVALAGAAVWYLGRGAEGRQVRIAVAAGLAIVLVLATLRTTVIANFQNDELATEYLVYAHGTPDDKEVYELLLAMQERMGEDDPFLVGYDNEVSWPFTWYFRNTDWNVAPRYLGAEPTDPVGMRELDAILVGSPNYAKFDPYLRDDYDHIEYRRMWWPNEGYKNLTFDRITETLRDPQLRDNLRRIVFFREYTADPYAETPEPKSLWDWYHHANMKLFVRRDVLDRAWPEDVPLPEGFGDGDREPRPSYRVEDLQVDLTWMDAAELPFDQPKDVAIDGDGTMWVVDHGNARVVGIDEDGELVATLGDGELRYAAEDGSLLPSAWGVGVGPDGAVYVADTWNHRILKYVDGEQVGSFGQGGSPPAFDEGLDLLFGPRDVAVDAEGFVYFTDTGNKRIVVLDPDLEPVRAFGGQGLAAGQLNEPTSLAFDPETGELVVADLWNLRVQVFDEDLVAVREWEVDGWESNEAGHKAYLHVGPGGLVIASDPVGARVWIWDREGRPLGTLDLVDDPTGLAEPIGVWMDDEGRPYVVSSSGRVLTRYRAPGVVSDALGGAAAETPSTEETGADETGDDASEDASDGADEAGEDGQADESEEAEAEGVDSGGGTGDEVGDEDGASGDRASGDEAEGEEDGDGAAGAGGEDGG